MIAAGYTGRCPKRSSSVYSNGEVTVVWQPALCRRSGICACGLPAVVFAPRRRPWIELQHADTATLVAQVRPVPPSGALSIESQAWGLPAAPELALRNFRLGAGVKGRMRWLRSRGSVVVLAGALTAASTGCGSAALKKGDVEALAVADANELDGCYDCLVDAHDTYLRLAVGKTRPLVVSRLFETDLLLALRRKELAMDAAGVLTEARALSPEAGPDRPRPTATWPMSTTSCRMTLARPRPSA